MAKEKLYLMILPKIFKTLFKDAEKIIPSKEYL
jgi:hypothetical protein